MKQHMRLQYALESKADIDTHQAHVRVALEKGSGPVALHGKVLDPALFRDAMLTALDFRASDLRFKARDRSQYLAYLMKKGKGATKEIWDAHKSFLDQSYADDKHKDTTLDPVWTVDPEQVSLEVFSKDESAYARLSLNNELFADRAVRHGTSFAELTPAFRDGLERLRTYHPLTIEAESTKTATSGTDEIRAARDIEVANQWLRGFLQVQSAAALPSTVAEFTGVDLYNMLFLLRTKKAKKAPRALRFELVPGMPARMVIEPWEVVLESHAGNFVGKSARIVRTFGRQRLLGLQRLLPHAQKVRVHLLGAGLPTFWVLECGSVTLTLALTGWTDAGWSSAATFDSLVPGDATEALAATLGGILRSKGPQSLDALVSETKTPIPQVRAGLQSLCLHGEALFDIARNMYRPRSIFGKPVEDQIVRFGSEREKHAHRLLEEKNAVKISKFHEIAGEGVEITGEVNDRAAVRTFAPRFTIDIEGRVRDAWCACPHYRRAAMREGPCEHMIALRTAYARKRAQEESMRNTPEGRKLIRAETRMMVRRDRDGKETVYRVTLDDKVVRIAWGARDAGPRQQRLWFDSDKDAREAYFSRLDALSTDGFIDAADA